MDYSQLYEKTDENDQLVMYHFKRNVEYEPDVPLVKGIVVNKSDNSVVCSTSFHSNEYDVDVVSEDNDIPNINWDNSIIMNAEEGCLIRVYFYNDLWYVSTHRKLDANTSCWGCKYSFRTLFDWALMEYFGESNIQTDFFDKLDKTLVYTFLLRNNHSNRIVCNAPSEDEPLIYFTGYYTNTSKLPSFVLKDTQSPVFEIPFIKLHCDFSSKKELLDYVKMMSYKKHQGVLVFNCENNDKLSVFKILCPFYSKFKNIRDNCSDLVFRYAHLRMDKNNVEDLRMLFPSYSHDFAMFENALTKISFYIANQYINRYVKKQYAMVTPLQYKITKKLREWYFQNPIENRVNSLVVSNFINKESPVYVYKLVNEFIKK